MSINNNKYQIIYQNNEITLQFDKNTLKGKSSLWLIWNNYKDIENYLYLNLRQCIVDNITINSKQCSFIHNDPLKMIIINNSNNNSNNLNNQKNNLSSSSSSSSSTTTTTNTTTTTSSSNSASFNGEEMDINYKAALEITRLGELQIQLPPNLTSSTQPFNSLPSKVPKEVFTRFEKLIKLQQEVIETQHHNRIILVVTIEYHLKTHMRNWAGWSFNLQNYTNSQKKNLTSVTQCWTNHGADTSLFCADGVRTWLPCIDDPSKQTIFDLSITVPASTKNLNDGNRSDRYRVMSSGVLVSSEPSINHSHMITYRYITPNRIPAYSLGIYIGIVKETFTTPLYLTQGHVWISKDKYNYSNDTNSLERSGNSNREKIENTYLSEQVTHTLLGLDIAVKHIHKSIQRVFTYNRCSIIFIPELDADYISYDGFFLINSNWLHTDSFIYLETPAHLLLLQGYLSTWFKGSILLDSYSSEFLLIGSIGFLINEYVDHIFGNEEARYRFLKQYSSIINYEKASYGTPLIVPFPEEYSRLGKFHQQYLQLKSTVLFHIICHRAGGTTEIILKAIKNLIKTRETQKSNIHQNNNNNNNSNTNSNNNNEMPPPNLSEVNSVNNFNGFEVPLIPGTPWYSPPTTPLVTSPPYSIPGTPTNTIPLSPLNSHFSTAFTLNSNYNNNFQNNNSSSSNMNSNNMNNSNRKRSDSMSSTSEMEISEETQAAWKLDPSEKTEILPRFPIHPPSLVQQVSTNSVSISSNIEISSAILEEAIWGSDLRGGNSSIIAFLADIKEISGTAITDLNETFIEQYINNNGCMFLRAGIFVNTNQKKVDMALHQVGFRNGYVDSARYIYKDKVPIHIVEAAVYQYSRRVDGKAHIVTFNLHTKPKKQGIRKRGLNAEELVSGVAQGPTFETLSLYDEFLAPNPNSPNDPSIKDPTQKPENLKYLCTIDDINGGRIQAQAITAIHAGTSTNLVCSASQSVQFIGIDPEIYLIREIHLNSHDDILIGQLYADMDIIGQVTALRALAQAHVSHQTISSQILRLRAIKDVILTGANEGNVVHSLAVRMEAIYCLAEWQNAHAPLNPRPKNEVAFGYNWAGLDILLGCLRGMFTDIAKYSNTNKIIIEMKDKFLPLPNDFCDHTKTQLRSALLIALSSIKTSNGETPPEVIEELLNFTENNDNNPELLDDNDDNNNNNNNIHSNSNNNSNHNNKNNDHSNNSNNENSSKKNNKNNNNNGNGKNKVESYDDGHYCTILLYCLSKVTCNPNSPNSPIILQRIIDVCKYYLHRESIITAAQIYEEEGNAGSGINRARGFYKLGEEISNQKQTNLNSIVGRGIVTAMALQCICNAEIQLDTSSSSSNSSSIILTSSNSSSTSTSIKNDQLNNTYEPFNYKSYITSPNPLIDNQKTKNDYEPPIVPHFSQLVRMSALDCTVRLAFAKHTARTLAQNSEVTSPTSKRDENKTRQSNDGINSGNKKNPNLSDIINLVLLVISNDPAREVRRSAALSLLFALQDRESFIPYKIISLSEPLQTFNWTDPSGLVTLNKDIIYRRNYSSEYRHAIMKSTTPGMKNALKKLWNFISSNSVAVYDQVIRCSLLYAWLYACYSKKTGKQQVPRSLVATTTQITFNHPNDLPLDDSNEPKIISNTNSNVTAVIQQSFKDRFPQLPYNGPLCVKDPVESCADLEEALRVGNNGRQMIKADRLNNANNNNNNTTHNNNNSNNILNVGNSNNGSSGNNNINNGSGVLRLSRGKGNEDLNDNRKRKAEIEGERDSKKIPTLKFIINQGN